MSVDSSSFAFNRFGGDGYLKFRGTDGKNAMAAFNTFASWAATAQANRVQPFSKRYKKELDPAKISQFGLVAEEVEKVNPDLVVRDDAGKVMTIRYEAVNAMLLNEFLKEHKAFIEEQHKVETLEATVADLIATTKEQAAQIQKVSGQLEASKPAPEVVNM
jgi:hypothetical protein